MLQTVHEFGLIRDGDRILVAVSGGKDSYTLLDLLHRAQRKAPVDFELVAFHLDQGHPGYDGGPLRQWLEDFGVRFEIHREDTYSTVVRHAAEQSISYCSPCSRFRRGILYTAAERIGCTKVALGHHREDTLETLLLNLLYGGKLQAMPASYTTNDGRFEVIRPLIECPEELIREQADLAGYPILPCNLCGSQGDLKRPQVKLLLQEIATEVPDVQKVMLAALKNVRASHLLDGDVAEAWERQAHRYSPRR